MKDWVAILCLLLANPVMVYIGLPLLTLAFLLSLLSLGSLLILLLFIWAVAAAALSCWCNTFMDVTWFLASQRSVAWYLAMPLSCAVAHVRVLSYVPWADLGLGLWALTWGSLIQGRVLSTTAMGAMLWYGMRPHSDVTKCQQKVHMACTHNTKEHLMKHKVGRAHRVSTCQWALNE